MVLILINLLSAHIFAKLLAWTLTSETKTFAFFQPAWLDTLCLNYTFPFILKIPLYIIIVFLNSSYSFMFFICIILLTILSNIIRCIFVLFSEYFTKYEALGSHCRSKWERPCDQPSWGTKRICSCWGCIWHCFRWCKQGEDDMLFIFK